MKKHIKILTLILAVVSVLALTVSCKENGNNGDNTTPTYCDYTVSIVDMIGKPMSDVTVNFIYPDGTTKKTRFTDENGVAILKNVESGDYKVVLEQGFSSATFDTYEYTLSATNNSLAVIAKDASKCTSIYGEVADNELAYVIGVGSYDVMWNGAEAYFVFNATNTGIYTFTIESDNADTTVGYYGIPMFVQATHRGEGEYDTHSFSITIQDSATPYVIGIKASNKVDAKLTVTRTGDAPFDPQFAPWTMIEKESDVEKCTIAAGVNLVDFDITDKNAKVYLADDGRYYTADGKPVYIRVTSSNETYLPGASLALLAGYVNDQIGMNIGGYVYDENGNFVEKRNYNLMIEDYMALCDDTYGVVPLTAELAECIQLHGKNTGWWNSASGNYIFGATPINVTNAWLFLCVVEG